MAYANEIRAIETGLARRLGALAGSIRNRMHRYRVYRETIEELGALSDRDLADLGIHRSMITSLARDASRGN